MGHPSSLAGRKPKRSALGTSEIEVTSLKLMIRPQPGAAGSTHQGGATLPIKGLLTGACLTHYQRLRQAAATRDATFREKVEGPILVIEDGAFKVVALASYTANTPVALRPPATRIDDRQQSGRRRITARDRARIVELYEQGKSARYVASDVGVSKATVLTTLKRAGVEMRPVGAHY